MQELTHNLLMEFTKGQPHAFRAVFDHYRMRIFYFVKNLIKDRHSAEEITSDTFVKLHRIHDRFETIQKIQSFLFITARNASIDYLRGQQRKDQLATNVLNEDEYQEAVTPLFMELDIEEEVLHYLYNEIEKLPPKSKSVFKLFYLEGKTISDIAELMNISMQTVANHKTTALKQIRIKMLAGNSLVYLILSYWEKR